ncbi:MAG TPA: cell division protein FtsQ/DivIB [Ornithinibacter sp.]|jgi:cell division protein FtsQ|uniref:cell division protein FtsQ/DivIB n=1 Tax=Ornithinibacter sp. TaxID=2862748 RepID=UPI001B6E29C3|nr:FtsQ-type POTRA domain-containing protein [Ornithinibacter sp.]MBP6524108.1 FtsQ-type POTRA domain-containing protein [Dermatophilaceae bacterium]MBU9943242.1 FtsQ-type POTRA domain-containing protein [Dermatophilaceae bacterium]HQV82981.1 cell division protein FtsQ/DivIB [Ornithinibacter sp.]HQW73606.1 cell division protein FtsQ/DivIB [Ornithinibacter sp.]HQX87406.1 cell division protein FtsQ/DivIB [Ornithinibacter sp.]
MSLRTERPAGGSATSSAGRFRERELANRRRPWRRALLALGAAGVVAGLVWVLGWSTLLGVSDIEVSGATGAEATAVAELVDVPTGTPLARVDTEAVAERVREQITVAEVSVSRSWPSTLAVDVVLQTPAIVVKNPQGQLEVVDAEGVAFKVVRSAPKGVPLVTARGSQGATREALQSALALLDALPPEMAGRVSGITVSSASLVTFALGNRTVVWGSGEESVRKVAILTALLPTQAKVIDVSAPDTPVTR